MSKEMAEGRLVFRGKIFCCEVCNVTMNGEINRSQHLSGMPHQLQVSKMKDWHSQLAAKYPLEQQRKQLYICKACNKEVSGDIPFHQHVVGRNHLSKRNHLLLRLRQEEADAGLPTQIGAYTTTFLDSSMRIYAKSILVESFASTCLWKDFDIDKDFHFSERFEGESGGCYFTASLTIPPSKKYPEAVVVVASGPSKKEAQNEVAVRACQVLSNRSLIMIPYRLFVQMASDHSTVEIETRFHGLIIGQEHKRVKKIMQDTMTYIKLDRSSPVITVYGHEADIKVAIHQMLEIIANAPSRPKRRPERKESNPLMQLSSVLSKFSLSSDSDSDSDPEPRVSSAGSSSSDGYGFGSAPLRPYSASSSSAVQMRPAARDSGSIPASSSGKSASAPRRTMSLNDFLLGYDAGSAKH